MVKIKVNPEAMLFLDSDINNSGYSLAYNWQTDQVYGINPDQFVFLRSIWNLGEVNLVDMKVDDGSLKDLLEKKIILKYEK